MPMCKLPQLRLVTYRGQSRMIVAIDVPAGLVELAPRPNTLDPSSAGEVGRPGLQYLGMRPVPGDVGSQRGRLCPAAGSDPRLAMGHSLIYPRHRTRPGQVVCSG